MLFRNLLIGLLLCGVALMSFAVESSADEKKPTVEKATRSGQVLESVLTGGQIWSSATHDEGNIFFGSDDGCLWAVGFEDAKPQWKACTGGRVRSTPAVADGKVYFASDDGFLYCLAASDGKRLWRFDLSSAGIERVLPHYLPPYGFDYLTSSPVLQAGTVYVGSSNGNLYAVNATSGEEIWHFTTGDRIRSTPTIHKDRLYIGSWDHYLYALNVENGEQVWRFDTGGIVQASPAIGDGRVYIGSRNPKVFALNAKTGEKVWEFEHTDGSWVESSGVYRDGVLYVGSSDALNMFAHDGLTGRVLWKYRTGGWSWSTPSVAGDTVYIGAISAYPYYFEGVTLERGLHAVDIETGKPRWVLPTRQLPGYVTGGVMATPLIVDGKIIAGALDSRLLIVSE
ncbi:MAG: PQQ-like beta-propeller repeat protein [bacterium]|nr:PQQ-like beta-propeller repeat protein [bacterium]